MTTAKSHRYCIKCLYELDGIQSRYCPECGKIFDRDNPKTWSRYPRAHAWTVIAKFAKALHVLLVVSTCVILILIAIGFDRLLVLLMGFSLTPLIMILLVIMILPWPHISAKTRVTSAFTVAVLILSLWTWWPFKLSVYFHGPALHAYIQSIEQSGTIPEKGWNRIGILFFNDVDEYNGNIGLQLSGNDGGGMFLVHHHADPKSVWINTNWEIELNKNWTFVYQD